MIVTPAAAGRQLVRSALPLPKDMVQEGQRLSVFDGQQEIDAAIRPLTWHPETDPRFVRRGLVTFPYAFADTKPVTFELRPVQAGEIHSAFPVEVTVDGETVRLQYADGPEVTAKLLASKRTSATEPRIETVEENAFFQWRRFHLPDIQWPRIVEVRIDALGGVVIIAHLQRRLSENGYAPDLGWEVKCEGTTARLCSGTQEAAAGHEPVSHDFSEGLPCALFFDDDRYRLDHPAAALKRRGRIDVVLENGKLNDTYWRCRGTDQVPMQSAAWRRVELVVAPAEMAPLRPTLEYPHQVQVDAQWWDELYSTGEPLALGAEPVLEALTDYHHRAVVRSMVQGDDWGNITSYTDDSQTGAVLGMNRLNHCPPIFVEGYRSGDQRLVEAAVLWCDNFYDHTVWWGEGDTGGTRYPNSRDIWRSNNAVNFCTKGYDSFFIAYEQTGDPRMQEALEAQVTYAAEHIHADRGECRNVGDVRDFVRLYRYTGQQRYLDQALRLFHELRSRLSTGDLFDQGGKPLQHDLPFVQDDRKGLRRGYAKPYIIGYALVGLPELMPLMPDEPKLRDVVRAVADFLAESQDPLGGWRYPHPRSGSVNLNHAFENAWQIVQADRVLGPSATHLDAIERVLRQRLWGWKQTGNIFGSLIGWETTTGALKEGQTLEDLYQRPEDRDFHRDYDQGNPVFGSSPPEGLIYFPEVLAFYLQHRPADRLLEKPEDEPLCQVLSQVQQNELPVAAPRYAVTVDYSKTIDEMIAVGQYARVRTELNAIPHPGEEKGRIEEVIELLHFGRSLHSDEALAELDRLGYRPADLVELLALGAAYPDLGNGPIVALGSTWNAPDGGQHVAYIEAHQRTLNLFTWDCGWVWGSRFACIRRT